MKLLRLKITDPAGFRSLQAGFEYHFRIDSALQDELGFAPFVCAGKNGSGKSNLLEVLAAIFYQLEVLRVRRSFLPDSFLYDEENNPEGFQEGDGTPNGFELEYLIRVPNEFRTSSSPCFAEVKVVKEPGHTPEIVWLNQGLFDSDSDDRVSEREREFLLPEYVLGYSSGENEILSLPFFKMRFIQFDEYWHSLREGFSYPGRPETRLAYMDSSFSQAILLCNLLFHDKDTLQPFHQDVGIEELKEFRIIIKRNISISAAQAEVFKAIYKPQRHPAIFEEIESGEHTLNLTELLEANEDSKSSFAPIITRLKRCATSSFVDEATSTLYLDYYVNDATKQVFQENFDGSPIALFQAFQVLLTLNLYTVSDQLKRDLYKSDSHYVSETVPVLASDERIMRFKFVQFSKRGIDEPVMLKNLSDGEHQLLHTLGLCLLFKNTNSLFLLDEPETHFNPDWRSNFISRLHQCFKGSEDSHEMLVTTHTPFLISDSRPEKVLVFKKENNAVSISNPDYNTLGASINKITMKTFETRETIGGHAQMLLEEFRQNFEKSKNDGEKEQLLAEIDQKLGDSVEKIFLINTILDSMEQKH